MYPPFIFCVMWLLDLAVIRSGLIEIYPVHGNTPCDRRSRSDCV